ncbi:hypothetical protein MPSEU_000918400 [Mayamaea pseudoterrestris]|nr:hypothetical protein MPSEU_000918400 [Mayamaea pseudoterrestris]
MSLNGSDRSITITEDDGDDYEGCKPGITLEAAAADSNIPAADVFEGDSQYSFEEHYTLEDRIAEGSFGQVFIARHVASNRVYAVKIILRAKLNDRDKDLVAREVCILKDCRDMTNIVRLVDYYSSFEKIYIVQLYAEGGDVFSRLATRTYFNEKDARDLAYQLLIAVRALHAKKIAHRDLKPENLLLRSLMRDSEILVADFGFASYVPDGGLKTRCGTPAFVAPEVLESNCRYNERCDMWSVGCLLYILIGGYPPFQARNHRLLFRKIRGADFCFHDQYFKHVSIAAKQLIASMLTVDPKYRVTAEQAIEKSRWIQMRAADLEKADLSASLGEMKKFQARTSLKGAMRTVLWSVQCKFKSVDDVGFGDQIKEWNKTDEARDRFERAYKTEMRPTLRFSDVYEIGKLLHRGRTEVYECRHKHEDCMYAVKMISATKPNRELAGKRSLSESIHHELAVLNSLNHRLILKIIDFFEEDDYYYFVTELMEGGDLFDRILTNQVYTEKDARDLARTLMEAVDVLHDNHITHRDIKPQNILMKSKDNNSDIKICDFAFACRVHTPQSLVTRCGTVRPAR